MLGKLVCAVFWQELDENTDMTVNMNQASTAS